MRWPRVDKYFADLGFATCGERPDYIPENVFYRLGKIIHCPHSVKRRVGVPRETRYTTCRQKISTRTKMYEFSRKATERWNARLTTTKYADWFKNMSAYGFTENIDYVSLSKNLENGGRSIDHQLTIPMAKELCMIQRNERGKQARQYFLAVEAQWNSPEGYRVSRHP